MKRSCITLYTQKYRGGSSWFHILVYTDGKNMLINILPFNSRSFILFDDNIPAP